MQPFDSSLPTDSWGIYRRTAQIGSLSSSLLVLICAIAFTLISFSSPDALYNSGNFPVLVILASIGGTSFIAFIVASCVHYLANRDTKLHLEDITRRAQEIDYIEQPAASAINQIRNDLLFPIIDSLEEVLSQMANRYGSIEGSKKNQLEKENQELKAAFKECKAFINKATNKHKVYITELLRYYGRGRFHPSLLLRRWIAAHHLDNAERSEQAQNHYQVARRSYCLGELTKALKNGSNADIMDQFPGLLENHFGFPDDELRDMGQEILKSLFARTKNNTEVLEALTQLRKIPSLGPLDLENFITLVQEKAALTQADYQRWSTPLIEHVVKHHLKTQVCLQLNTFASNLSIMQLLFKKIDEKAPLDDSLIPLHNILQTLGIKKTRTELMQIAVSNTLLFAESSDYIVDVGRHRDIYTLQSALNLHRKPGQRIALLALPQEEQKDLATLKEDHDLIKRCFTSHPHPLNLTKAEQEAIDQLGAIHSVRLIALPITIPDHLFKQLIDHIGTLRSGLTFAKPILGTLLKALIPNKNPTVASIANTLIDLLVSPLIVGALQTLPSPDKIDRDSFTYIFQTAITEKGQELIDAIHELTQKDPEEIPWEAIESICSNGFRSMAQAFSDSI